MPTTLTGLLLFVVLLLPGFAYLVGKERGGTERHSSPFRESVSIVAASVTCEIVVLILFGMVRWLWPSSTPDTGAIVSGGSAYLRSHYREVAVWGVILLASAVGLAYTATIPAIRRAAAKLPLIGAFPHDSTVSAWWLLFERLAEDHETLVGCVLDDGSYVRGQLQSYNNSADDSPDRELILCAPITYRAAGDHDEKEYPVSGVCVAARHIVILFVSYLEEITSSSEEAAVAEQPATTAASSPSPS